MCLPRTGNDVRRTLKPRGHVQQAGRWLAYSEQQRDATKPPPSEARALSSLEQSLGTGLVLSGLPLKDQCCLRVSHVGHRAGRSVVGRACLPPPGTGVAPQPAGFFQDLTMLVLQRFTANSLF